MDPTLSEFDTNEATRLIGVALLCTQASPMVRPPMSRVVAMLAGDIEMSSTAISKPSYLTDWNFKDMTSSFLNENDETPTASKSHERDEHGNATSHSSGTDRLLQSPINVSESVISDVIGDGR